MRNELTISFQYSASDHAEALAHGASRQKRRRNMHWLGLFVVVVGVLIVGLDLMRADALAAIGLLNLFSWSAAVAYGVWAGPLFAERATGWVLRQWPRKESIDTERLIFTDHGFSPSSEWSQPMPWSFVDRVVETERLLLIYHGYSTDPVYVPKHALSPLAAERLFALFREHLRARPQRLQLVARAT